MRDDPELTHAVVHALNEWMHETWQFDYEERIFTTPVITLPIVEKAHRGARVGARARRQGRPRPARAGARPPRARVRSACPSSTRSGSGSSDADVLVAMHSSDSGYERYANDWIGSDSEMLPFQPEAFRMLSAWRPVEDAVSALVCHGALSRFPKLKVAVVENGSSWVEPLLETHGRRLQEDAAGLPRGPDRGRQAQHLHQPVLGGGPRRAGRAPRRGPRALRLRLPAPRGSGRAGQLRRRARRASPRTPSARSWAATWPG